MGMDWPGIIREVRMLLIEIPPDRFYALYGLLAVIVVSFGAFVRRIKGIYENFLP